MIKGATTVIFSSGAKYDVRELQTILTEIFESGKASLAKEMDEPCAKCVHLMRYHGKDCLMCKYEYETGETEDNPLCSGFVRKK